MHVYTCISVLCFFLPGTLTLYEIVGIGVGGGVGAVLLGIVFLLAVILCIKLCCCSPADKDSSKVGRLLLHVYCILIKAMCVQVWLSI